MSHPLILALPELGEKRPVNMLIVVVLPASVRVICTYDDDQHVGEYEHEDGDQHVAYIFSMHVSSSLLLSCLLRCDPGER